VPLRSGSLRAGRPHFGPGPLGSGDRGVGVKASRGVDGEFARNSLVS
jgi:hypothetical protein